MTELLNRPESQAEDAVDVSTLQEMFDTQNPREQSNNQESNHSESDISPIGSALLRSATRINNILEQRAINKAHGEALKEYRDRDYNDYIDHLEAVTDSPDTTPTAKASARMDLDREHLKADAKKTLERATGKVKRVGRATLSFLRDAGDITLGLGLASAEVAGRSVKKTAEVAKTGTAKFSEKAGDSVIAGMKKVESGMDAAGAKIETIKQNREADKLHKEAVAENRKRDEQHEKALKRNEKLDRARERKDAALARKQARRQKWVNLKAGAKEYAGYVKEGFVETKDVAKNKLDDTKERAKRKARIYRSAGRQALATYRDAIDIHKQ